jgi:hypothetical protein
MGYLCIFTWPRMIHASWGLGVPCAFGSPYHTLLGCVEEVDRVSAVHFKACHNRRGMCITLRCACALVVVISGEQMTYCVFYGKPTHCCGSRNSDFRYMSVVSLHCRDDIQCCGLSDVNMCFMPKSVER